MGREKAKGFVCSLCGETFPTLNEYRGHGSTDCQPEATEIEKELEAVLKKGQAGTAIDWAIKKFEEMGKTIDRQAGQLRQLEDENKRLRDAIEWAVERMDEEPAKEDLKKALERR